MATSERIVMVKLVNPVQFLGISGSQLAPTQGGGIELTEVTKGVSVRSSAHPGKRFLIHNANIAHIQFEAVE